MPTPRKYPRPRIARRGGHWIVEVLISDAVTTHVPGAWSSQLEAFEAAKAWIEGGTAPAPMPTEPASTPPAPKPAALAALPKPVPTRCPDCKRRVRRPREHASEWPDTVCMTDKEGRCSKCKRARQTAVILADAERTAREAQEALEAAAREEQRQADEAAAALAAEAEAEARAKAAIALVVLVPDEEAAAMVEQLEPEQPSTTRRKPKSQKDAPACKEPGCTKTVGPASRTGTCAAHRVAQRRAAAVPVVECSTEECHEHVTSKRAKGLCNTHAEEARLAEPMTEREKQALRAAEALAADRRRRGVPPEGKRTA